MTIFKTMKKVQLHKKSDKLIYNPDQCIMCGEYVPEGYFVCRCCVERITKAKVIFK